jgi:hypothetical protein
MAAQRFAAFVHLLSRGGCAERCAALSGGKTTNGCQCSTNAGGVCGVRPMAMAACFSAEFYLTRAMFLLPIILDGGRQIQKRLAMDYRLRLFRSSRLAPLWMTMVCVCLAGPAVARADWLYLQQPQERILGYKVVPKQGSFVSKKKYSTFALPVPESEILSAQGASYERKLVERNIGLKLLVLQHFGLTVSDVRATNVYIDYIKDGYVYSGTNESRFVGTPFIYKGLRSEGVSITLRRNSDTTVPIKEVLTALATSELGPWVHVLEAALTNNLTTNEIALNRFATNELQLTITNRNVYFAAQVLKAEKVQSKKLYPIEPNKKITNIVLGLNSAPRTIAFKVPGFDKWPQFDLRVMRTQDGELRFALNTDTTFQEANGSSDVVLILSPSARLSSKDHAVYAKNNEFLGKYTSNNSSLVTLELSLQADQVGDTFDVRTRKSIAGLQLSYLYVTRRNTSFLDLDIE